MMLQGADQLMILFLKVFASCNPTVHGQDPIHSTDKSLIPDAILPLPPDFTQLSGRILGRRSRKSVAKVIRVQFKRKLISIVLKPERLFPVTQVQQAVSLTDELKCQNLELHPTPVVAEPEDKLLELIYKPIDPLMEKQASPKNDFSRYTQLELAVKDLLSGNVVHQLNRSPFEDSLNITERLTVFSKNQPTT
ncbi:hypothetical protein AAG906_025648 [Vitis piasezkii]